MLQLRTREVRLIAALADRIRDVHPDGPRRVVAAEQLAEHRSERGDGARADDGAGETAGAEHLRAAEADRLIAGAQAHVGQPLVPRVLHADLRALDVLACANEIGPLRERS